MDNEIMSPCDFAKDEADAQCPYCVQPESGYESEYVCAKVMVNPSAGGHYYRYHGQRPCSREEAKECPLRKKW